MTFERLKESARCGPVGVATAVYHVVHLAPARASILVRRCDRATLEPVPQTRLEHA